MSQRLPIKRPKNPCTGVCRIDKSTGLCRGCWRTRDEIKGWKKLNEADRDGVLAAIALRRSRKRGDVVGAQMPPTAVVAPAAAGQPGRDAASASPAPDTPARVPPAASPVQAADAPAGGLPRWRHRKSGRIVVELHRARAKTRRLRKGTEMIVYRDDQDQVWVRPAAEFDRRFVPLWRRPPAPPGGAQPAFPPGVTKKRTNDTVPRAPSSFNRAMRGMPAQRFNRIRTRAP